MSIVPINTLLKYQVTIILAFSTLHALNIKFATVARHKMNKDDQHFLVNLVKSGNFFLHISLTQHNSLFLYFFFCHDWAHNLFLHFFEPCYICELCFIVFIIRIYQHPQNLVQRQYFCVFLGEMCQHLIYELCDFKIITTNRKLIVYTARYHVEWLTSLVR